MFAPWAALSGSDSDFCIDADKIRPDFISNFERLRPFTTFELASEFAKLCSTKKKHDVYLAVIEVDRRFPDLSNEDIGRLFPASGEYVEDESAEKRGYRLRKEAYKYKNISFDHLVS